MSRNLPVVSRRIAALLLVCSMCTLVGCANEEMRKELDFSFALPSSWNLVNIERLDTDGDAEREWVILYTFDTPSNAAFAPVRCAIYHIARREPSLPIIYPYHLQAPGWTYLGEGGDRTQVEMKDVITHYGLDPRQVYSTTEEVIVQSKDGNGQVTRASIFQWRDNVQDKRVDPREVVIQPNLNNEQGQWYECVGLFEGSLRVDIQPDAVAVWDRLNDRSQLARVNVYKPSGSPGGYLLDNHELVAPTLSCIDFAFGRPEALSESPYPEKIVIAFLQEFTEGPLFGSQYLTDQAKRDQQNDSFGYWRPFASDTALPTLCIKELSYDPDSETQVQVQAIEERIGQVTANVETRIILSNDQNSTELKAVWQMLKQDNIWKIHQLASVRLVE